MLYMSGLTWIGKMSLKQYRVLDPCSVEFNGMNFFKPLDSF